MSNGKKILACIAFAAGHTLLESARVACYRTARKSEQVQKIKEYKAYRAIGDAITVCKNVVDTALAGYMLYKAFVK